MILKLSSANAVSRMKPYKIVGFQAKPPSALTKTVKTVGRQKKLHPGFGNCVTILSWINKFQMKNLKNGDAMLC